MDYNEFFELATRDGESSGHTPFPYQKRLGEGSFPTLLDIPTGLGKTAAVTVAWLYRRLTDPADTPRRLVYCLPMRSLVTQTAEEARKWVQNTRSRFEDPAQVPTTNVLMGGNQQLDWVEHPERPAIVVGTQDMLISRALMRGYGMSRYKWPVHYGLLHNDAFWVFDETQLMGVTVETSAQLHAFRSHFATAGSTGSLWMSATLSDDHLDTVDNPRPAEGWHTLTLGDEDYDNEIVRRRTSASKPLRQADATVPRKESDREDYASDLAAKVGAHHVDGTLTLVISNRVDRAREIYRALLDDHDGRDESNTTLLHSRFRRRDREDNEQLLHADGDRVVVATQVVEAGLDVSAQTMFTELAPWPSLVQRFGRCNRRGEQSDAQIFWIDIEYSTSAQASNDGLPPYELDEILDAKDIVEDLSDAGPEALGEVSYDPPAEIRPVLRRKDLLELFDTTPDLSGHDIDVSRYVRDEEDTDVQFYWRVWETEDGTPPGDLTEPDRNELCRVSIGAARKFAAKRSVDAWQFDGLDERWRRIDASEVRPGQTLLLHRDEGGYDPDVGWTGSKRDKLDPDDVTPPADSSSHAGYDEDPDTRTRRWIGLADHLAHVGETAERLADCFGLDERTRQILSDAARWHDVGKAHPVFQRMLLDPVATEDSDIEPPEGDGPWAKSNHNQGSAQRKHFRHELASALAYLDHRGNADDFDTSLVAYLVAAHHGKVRLSIRSLPGETEPDDERARPDLYARGVWHGDEHPAVDVPALGDVGPFQLDLELMEIGQNSWLERTLELRDELGPFQLAWLEALLRVADWRASAAEETET